MRSAMMISCTPVIWKRAREEQKIGQAFGQHNFGPPSVRPCYAAVLQAYKQTRILGSTDPDRNRPKTLDLTTVTIAFLVHTAALESELLRVVWAFPRAS